MARRRNSLGATLQRPRPWVTEEAAADDYKLEREYCFEHTTCTVAGVETVHTRLNAFILSENNRASFGEDRLASQNVAELQAIIDKKCRQEEAGRNPDSFIAQKRSFERSKIDLEQYLIDPLVRASKELQREYSKRRGQYVRALKPLDIPDAPWRRAQWRINAEARKQGIEKDFDIGNGRPPKDTQFGAPGRAANTSKPASLWHQAKQALEMPAKGKTRSGKDVEISRRELKLINTYQKAIGGSASARREFMNLVKELDKRNLLDPVPSMRRRKNHPFAPAFAALGELAYAQAIERLRLMYERRYGGLVGEQIDNDPQASAAPLEMPDHAVEATNRGFRRKSSVALPTSAIQTRKRQRIDPGNTGQGRGPGTASIQPRKRAPKRTP